MARRTGTLHYTCAEPGCREQTHRAYEGVREGNEIAKRQHDKPWKCTRHANPDKVLRPDNQHVTTVMIATRIGDSPGLYWLREGETSGSGFTFGPGFNAHAADVPEFTRLVIEARLELPDDPEPAR